MKHQLERSNTVANPTESQAKAIISLAGKLGIPVYEESKTKIINEDYPHIRWSGSDQICHSCDTDASTYIPFDEFIARMLGVFEPQHKEVKLNIGKTAIVKKDSITVGCTTLEADDVNDIFKAWEEVRERP